MSNGTAGKVSKLYQIQDELVLRAEKLVAARAQAIDVGKTQMSRAVATASAPGVTPRVFINWLRCQAAREKDRSQFWTLQSDSRKSLAEEVADQIDWIVQQPDLPNKTEAITRFLGYMRRALVGAEWLDVIRLTGDGGTR